MKFKLNKIKKVEQYKRSLEIKNGQQIKLKEGFIMIFDAHIQGNFSLNFEKIEKKTINEKNKKIYSKKEYIIFSKINNDDFILNKKENNFIKLIIKSIDLKINILNDNNEKWLISNCSDLKIFNLIKKFNTLKELKQAKKDLEICKENKIKLITYEDKIYPEKFKEINSPPLMIYYKGTFPKDKNLKNSTAIVGSRNCYENYGGKLAETIGKRLSKNKKWNISGLALGIDTFGHKGSLSENGYTGAFIAQGFLTSLFPEKNKYLAEQIIEKKGFIATEYPLYSKVVPRKFILRNRLQAGIVDFVVVPEFSEKSGTLSTIEFALKLKKIVYICSPEKSIERNKLNIQNNKGSILFCFPEEKIKQLYPNLNMDNFKKTRLYKIRENKSYKYQIIKRIPKFDVDMEENDKL